MSGGARDPEAVALFQRRVESIARSPRAQARAPALGSVLGDGGGGADAGGAPPGMLVTAELLADYSGHEFLLRERARHAPHCYAAYDALRLCLVQRVSDAAACGRVAEAYRPCARELQRDKMRRMMALDDERRRILQAKAAVLEQKQGERGAAAAAAAAAAASASAAAASAGGAAGSGASLQPAAR
jgi:hypothetical protein